MRGMSATGKRSVQISLAIASFVVCGVLLTKLTVQNSPEQCAVWEAEALLSNPMERLLVAAGKFHVITTHPDGSMTVVAYTAFRVPYAVLEVRCDGPSRVIRHGW